MGDVLAHVQVGGVDGGVVRSRGLEGRGEGHFPNHGRGQIIIMVDRGRAAATIKSHPRQRSMRTLRPSILPPQFHNSYNSCTRSEAAPVIQHLPSVASAKSGSPLSLMMMMSKMWHALFLSTTLPYSCVYAQGHK